MNETPSNSLFPIRPTDDIDMSICGICEDDGWEDIADSHLEAERRRVQGNDVEDVIDIDEDEVVQPAVPMPVPLTPSKADVERHNIKSPHNKDLKNIYHINFTLS